MFGSNGADGSDGPTELSDVVKSRFFATGCLPVSGCDKLLGFSTKAPFTDCEVDPAFGRSKAD